MDKKIERNYDFAKEEQKVIDFWNENEIFKKAVEKNDVNTKNYVFYDGPPTANGKPHIGHVLTRVVKDVIPRYKTMQGYHVERKAGWDTHGLPVELEVEKQIHTNGKADIEAYGVEPFIQKCRESVWTYKDLWERMSERVGYWCDFEHPYITYTNDYIESVWWGLKQLDNKGLIYKGYRVSPYCPRCSTALSSHEVAQGYKDIKTSSIFFRLKVKGEDNTYFAVWTTTPWTVISNVALCVNKEFDYSKVLVDGDYYYIATELCESLFGEEYETVSKCKGADLLGMEYEPAFTYLADSFKEKAYYVVEDNYVSLDAGTGIVHISPAFGEDDARVGRENNLPCPKPVDFAGKFTDVCGVYTGMLVFDADEPIIKELIDRKVILKVKKIEHSYPHCWRCNSPLIYYAKDSWFIAMSTLRDELVADNRSVNWFPDNFKEGRMGNFVGNVIDWAVSRDRYWGTPLPIWVCEECGHKHVVGSVAELVELTGADPDVDLHKPMVDRLTMTCPECGKTMYRTPEVCDCWLDSGSMPYAQHHYPFENKEKFQQQFPADFISEGSDQTRGWFYALQALSTAIFGKSPYKNCIALGLVNDEKGIKMSKHIGNVVDPWEVLDEFGSDATRLYFCIANAPWVSTSFNKQTLGQFQNRFIGTLWASVYFYSLYSEIDGFDPSKYSLSDCKLRSIDEWVLSRTNSLVKKVTKEFDSYHVFEATRAMESFIDELSNWYIRRNRRRFFNSELSEDKIAAYMTLYTVLDTLTRVVAPVTPFVAETIYQGLVVKFFPEAPISVHLADFPKDHAEWDKPELEAQMEVAYKAVEIGRKLRELVHIRNRQPLSECIVKVDSDIKLDDEQLGTIAEELNVDKVLTDYDMESLIQYEIKPQLKTLGPKYGRHLKAIGEYFCVERNTEIINTIKTDGVYRATIDGAEIELTMDDLLVTEKAKEGYIAETNYGVSVILNTALNDDLIERGSVREFISKVQNLRKSSGLEVTDHIVITAFSDDYIKDVIAKNEDFIKSELLCDSLTLADTSDNEFKIDEHKVNVTITKA
ncbi:MAG: isoleucine--tRNA ligase [Clostridia bacterium]|nr:isoleucine--tRNA ligase [Clostridia bacterium]